MAGRPRGRYRARRIVGLLFLSGLVVAAPGASAPQSPPPLSAARSALGTIERYDAAQRTLVVRTSEGRQLVFILPRDVQITRGARRLAPHELARCVGQRVKVRYVEARNRNIAQTVAVASESPATPGRLAPIR